MKICITGATGFVGLELLHRFIDHDIPTVALVRKNSPSLNALKHIKTEIRYFDLKDDVDNKLFSDIDIVFHLAGSVFSKKKGELIETNVTGTKKLYGAMRHTNVQKFVFLSSLAAVGPSGHNQEITEDKEPNPISWYGKSKLLAEQSLLAMRDEIKTEICIIRAPLIYGKGMSKQSRMAIFMEKLKTGAFRYIGDGQNIISLCQLDNLVNFMMRLIEFKDIDRQIFHISDPDHVSMLQIAEMASKCLGMQRPTKKVPIKLALAIAGFFDMVSAVTPLEFYLSRERVKELSSEWKMSTQKIRRYGYEPMKNWREAFEQTVKWINGEL